MYDSIPRKTLRPLAFCGVLAIAAAGCNKKADNTANFKSALDSFYSAHPVCLWPQPIQFPQQTATSDTSKTAPFDALVDQGLLVRTSVEKKKLLVMSQQENNYDLSNKGRTLWTADTAQPGFGNFCYGHRTVSSIDSSTPTSSQPGATTQVSFHTGIADAPSWATAPETQNAFPQLQADLSSPQTAHATLTNTTSGWQVSSTSDSGPSSPPGSADGRIVQ